MLTNQQTAAPIQPEIRVRLPQRPRNITSFNSKLVAWSREQKVAARLDILDVVVTLGLGVDAAGVQQARGKLLQLLGLDFPEFKAERTSGSSQDADAAGARAEELQSLEETYGQDLEILGDMEWRIRLRRDDALRVLLPPGYPLTEPPAPVVECASNLQPWFSKEELLVLWTPGHQCVYDWVEKVREALIDAKLPSSRSLTSLSPSAESLEHRGARETEYFGGAAKIVEGEPLILKGCTFQGYIVQVSSQKQAAAAHKQLLQMKTLAAAAFHVSAYRLEGGSAQLLVNSEGSRAAEAGSQLLAKLDERKLENVLVLLLRTTDVAVQNQLRLNPALLLRQDEKVARRLLDQWSGPRVRCSSK